jgi:hypothetical protein
VRNGDFLLLTQVALGLSEQRSQHDAQLQPDRTADLIPSFFLLGTARQHSS